MSTDKNKHPLRYPDGRLFDHNSRRDMCKLDGTMERCKNRIRFGRCGYAGCYEMFGPLKKCSDPMSPSGESYKG